MLPSDIQCEHFLGVGNPIGGNDIKDMLSGSRRTCRSAPSVGVRQKTPDFCFKAGSHCRSRLIYLGRGEGGDRVGSATCHVMQLGLVWFCTWTFWPFVQYRRVRELWLQHVRVSRVGGLC